MPSEDRALEDAAIGVVRASADLGGALPPLTRRSIAALLRNMNSYYSNLIEGHKTHPRDIEQAAQNVLVSNQTQRALQLEARAHIQVQELMEQRLDLEPDLKICSADFLCWLHREFYVRLPAEMLVTADRKGKEHKITPGALRTVDVEVGEHVPPRHETIPLFLARFAEAYDPARLGAAQKVIASAASHHRLAWIHPFLDGNGRVTRLFSHAYFTKAGVDSHGMWTITRGMARYRDKYMAALTQGDLPRQGDLDGRGNLSERGLKSFCQFFFQTAVDQIEFMKSLLDLSHFEENVKLYIARRKLLPELAYLIVDLMFRGQIARGDAAKVLGLKPARSRFYINALLKAGVFVSDTPKGPIRLSFPVDAAESFFPRLFPAQ